MGYRKEHKMHGVSGVVRVVIIYYWILTVISVLASVVSIATCYWTDSLYVDGSFIIWVLLAKYLAKRRRAARTWAIIISSISLSLIAAIPIAALLGADAWAYIGSRRLGPESPLFYVCIVSFAAIFGFPLLLLHPSAKAQFECK